MTDDASLRDYFAAQAMVAILSLRYGRNSDFDSCAADAYVMADAMLKARDELSNVAEA